MNGVSLTNLKTSTPHIDEQIIVPRLARKHRRQARGTKLRYRVPESCKAFFMPAQLMRVDSSWVGAPCQWVSRLTAP